VYEKGDPDLAAVINAWPMLSNAVKAWGFGAMRRVDYGREVPLFVNGRRIAEALDDDLGLRGAS
jgi:hypothetical protein